MHPYSLSSAYVIRSLQSIIAYLTNSNLSSVAEQAGLSHTWL